MILFRALLSRGGYSPLCQRASRVKLIRELSNTTDSQFFLYNHCMDPVASIPIRTSRGRLQ
jgi:hypothetical protein